MQSQTFEITLARISIQVLIMVIVPSAFVMIPVLLLINLEISELLYFVIFFFFIILSLFLTIRLVKNSTRKGTLVVNEKGLQILFNDKNIFYNHLNNRSIGWEDVSKVAYNFDSNHNMPFIIFRFTQIKGSFICMQEDSKGMDESNWPLWQTLDQYVNAYNHVHREHKISNRRFYDAWWFKILLWAGTFLFIASVIYKILYPLEAPGFENIFKLLIFLVPAHLARWMGRKSKQNLNGNRASDNS